MFILFNFTFRLERSTSKTKAMLLSFTQQINCFFYAIKNEFSLFLSLNSTVFQSTLKPSDYDQHLQMRVKKKKIFFKFGLPFIFKDFLYFIFNEMLLFPSVFDEIVISSIFFQILFHWERHRPSRYYVPPAKSVLMCCARNITFLFNFTFQKI